MIALRAARFLAASLAAFAFVSPVLAAPPPPVTVNEEAELFMTTPAAQAGSSVSISGNTAVVGAPHASSDTGQVDVYVRTPGTHTWTFQATITATGANAGAAGDLFGASVSVSGDNVAIGAAGRNSSAGAAYVFNRSGSTWTQTAYLTRVGGIAGDKFGNSVSMDGLTVLVGAPFATVGGKVAVGAAYAFAYNSIAAAWQLQSSLTITTGPAKAGDHIGWSVALSGNTAAIGAPDDDHGNAHANAGSVFIFIRNGNRWRKTQYLNPSATLNNRMGASVALNGNTAVFGVDGPASNGGKGFAYVYTRSGTSFSLTGTLTASDGLVGDHFGASVAVSGSVVVVGAPQTGSLIGGGKAYVYAPTGVGGAYQEIDHLVPTLGNAIGDNFGTSVAMDAGRALVGAPNAVPSGTASGNGAGYVFLVNETAVVNATITSPTPPTQPVSGPGTAYAGQDYTVHFTVAAEIGTDTPTGFVNVDDGNGGGCADTVLPPAGHGTGSVQLVSAQGTCTMNSDIAGLADINVSYLGDSLFGGASASPIPQELILQVPTTTTLTFTPDPSSVVGQSVTATVSVAATPPAGVTLDVNAAAPTGILTVSDGVGADPTCTIDMSLTAPPYTCPLTFNAVGPYNYTASFAADPSVNPATYGYAPSTSSPATAHVVSKAATTVTVNSNTPTVFGQNAAIVATVHVTAPGGGTPTGNVSFFDGATPLSSVALSGSTATLNTTTLSVGAHSITATYNGDGNYNASPASPTFTHTVTKAATTTNLSQDIQPSVVGQTVTFTSHVLVTAPGAGTPSGTISVSNGTQNCSILLPAISCTIAFTSTGTHNVTATYTGDGNFSGSASAPLSHTTNPASASVTISQVANPSQVNDPVTVFVTVSGPGAVPTGSVAVTTGVGNPTCNIAALSALGKGSCIVTFTVPGPVTIHAAYSGDVNYSAGGADQAHTTSAPSGYHLVVDSGPASILVGKRLATVTVSIHQDTTNTLKSADNSTQVTLSLTTQPCGDPVFFGPVTVAGGIATFSNVGPIFYNTYSGLSVRADDSAADTHANSATFNVTAPNPELVFSNGFDSCRL